MLMLQGMFPGRDIHTIDFAGHGTKATTTGGFSIAHFAQEVVDYLDVHNIAQADVFGYSMGGYVGLYLAQRHPERIGKIATLGTKYRWSVDYAQRQQRMLDAEAIAAKVPKFAAALAARHGEESWKPLLARTSTLMAALGERPLLDDGAFAAIAHPTLLLVGDRDDTVSVEEVLEVSRLLPGGVLGVLPNTGHPMERVDAALLASLFRWFFGPADPQLAA